MDKPSFVYTTYINASPEQVWEALTSPAFTERYWGVRFESDWQPGSTMTHYQDGVTIDSDQVVLVSEPYRRLSYTWHAFTPEWAELIGRRIGFSDEFLAKVAAEPRSKVTFEIEDVAPLVKLTVVHDDFEPGSAVLGTISQGWPRVLSGLKTLLETGETLPKSMAGSRNADSVSARSTRPAYVTERLAG